jgi:hypothetical protein
VGSQVSAPLAQRGKLTRPVSTASLHPRCATLGIAFPPVFRRPAPPSF